VSTPSAAEPAFALETAPRRRGLRRMLPYLVTVAAIALAAVLLWRILRTYSLEEILASLRATPPLRLAACVAFAAASYLCLTRFDALALRYVGRPLPHRQVAVASFVSLSIGHSLGMAALSSGAVRYRFYSRWGLNAVEVAQVIVFCGVTVTLGLATLGALAFLLEPSLAVEITGLGRGGVTAVGLGALLVPGAYLALAASRRESLRLPRFRLRIPSLGLALGQIGVGTLNFACVAACLHQALSAAAEVSYLGVAAVYAIANLTAIVSHVPGGVGVIESMVLFLLPGANAIGALVLFRIVYYLVPLALGGVTFAAIELSLRRRSARKRP